MAADREHLQQDSLVRAAGEITRGHTVALSTETVWGLTARFDQEVAVRRIYTQKGRPGDKALQLLCASSEVARRFASLDAAAEKLWSRLAVFWPGALTLVVPASARCPAWLVQQGGVGLRVPASPLACRLLEGCGGALVGTSLNRSGEAPVTTYAQALALGLADFVLPGPDALGVASTVYHLGERRVLRAGALGEAQLHEALGTA